MRTQIIFRFQDRKTGINKFSLGDLDRDVYDLKDTLEFIVTTDYNYNDLRKLISFMNQACIDTAEEKQKKLIKEIEELKHRIQILRERYNQLETHLDYLSDSEDEYDEWLGILEEE